MRLVDDPFEAELNQVSPAQSVTLVFGLKTKEMAPRTPERSLKITIAIPIEFLPPAAHKNDISRSSDKYSAYCNN